MPSAQPTISFALLHQVGSIPGAPGAGPLNGRMDSATAIGGPANELVARYMHEGECNIPYVDGHLSTCLRSTTIGGKCLLMLTCSIK